VNPGITESIRKLTERAKAGDATARAALQRFVQANRNLRIARARECPSTFLGYVMKDEETGGAIQLAPYHRHLQDFLSDDSGRLGGYKGILGHIECGKTMNITVGRVLWELGRNPNLRIAIVMATKEKVKATIRLIGQYLEKSQELREVFPHLFRSKDKRQPWNTTQLTVNRSAPIKDPSVQGLGIGSNILGARLDLVILDDALTALNTLTARARKAVDDYIVGTLAGRVGKTGRIWFIANAWHPEDAWHMRTKPRVSGGGGWRAMILPAAGPVLVKDRHGKAKVVCGEDGVSNWPGRWTPEYLELKTELFGGPDHPETARLLYCQARSDDAARFKRAWIDDALAAGAGLYGDALSVQTFDPPPGWKTFTGMDLGVKKHLGADLTVQFHLAVRPNGMIQVMGLESGRYAADETLRRVFDAHKRYTSTIIVETVAAQDYIRGLAKSPEIARALGRLDADRLPVHPFTTRGNGTVGNKHSAQFGVESIGAEMATGRWIIPCVQETAEDGTYVATRVHPEIEAWIQDMLYYDPHGHMGDRLAACWFAHNGARRRTFGWQVDFADAPPEERGKHWTELEREEAEERSKISRDERQRQQRQAQVDSAWGDFDW
jgi:hypothetical protein